MSASFFLLMQLAILAYALVAGVFLAFSDFIMRALATPGGIGGIEAMQVINREVFRWVFMVLFIGMAPVSLIIAAYGGIFVGSGPGMLMMFAGLIYFVVCFGVTVFFNVPAERGFGEDGCGGRRDSRFLAAHLCATVDLLELCQDGRLCHSRRAAPIRAGLDDPIPYEPRLKPAGGRVPAPALQVQLW